MRTLIIISLFISSIIFGQNSGFIYELTYKPSTDNNEIEKIIFHLDVKNKQSLFRSEMFRQSDSLRITRGYGNGYDMAYNNKQLYIEKDHITKKVKKYVFVPLVFSTYTINVDEKLNWEISEEKLKISSYNCQKATVEYGGRKWTAWFTTDIMIPDGPYVFSGLPGLIVKISDETLDYQFNLLQVQDFKWKDLYPEKSQKVITWNEFEKLQKNLYSDPLAMINKQNITTYDDAGNEVKTDFKFMKENAQKRIIKNNNPVELNHKVKYK